MTTLKRNLELAGLFGEDGRGLGRAVQTGKLYVPPVRHIKKSRALIWDRKDATPKVAPAELLHSFVALSDPLPGLSLKAYNPVRDKSIVSFAKNYGVLALCFEHHIPYTHNRPLFYEPAKGGIVDEHGCLPHRNEPLQAWLYYSDHFRLLLDIAARLIINKKPTVQDCSLLTEFREQTLPHMGEIRERFFTHLNTLLLMAGVGPHLEWVKSSVRISFRTASLNLQANKERLGVITASAQNPNLFGHLMIQLASVIGGAEGLAYCSNCGSAYIVNRQPDANRRRYCQDCKGAASRDASRAYRLRQKHNPTT